MTALARHPRAARAAPGRALARWAAFLVTLGCAAAHIALLLRGPSVLTVVMTLLAALCVACLAPGRRPLSPGAWGAAMVMSAGMMLLHIRSGGGIDGHAHAGLAATAGLDGLHGAALLLNGVELALLMGVVIAIGVLRRLSADSGSGSVNID